VTTFIHAGWLIDGSGGPVRKKVLLNITGGSITGVDTHDPANPPDSSCVTDLSHCTILPPFVDSHVHLALSATIDPVARKRQLEADYETIQPLISQHIHHHFSHGVLAVRDGGDSSGHVLRYKLEEAGNVKEPVMIKVTGKAWHQEGRYGALIGRTPDTGESLSTACAKDTSSTDFVKLVNSGLNSLSEFGHETSPQFNLDEIKKVVQHAAQQGKKVMAHANGKESVRMALDAGCHSIEHGFFMGRDNLMKMAEQQVTWVPTAYTMKAAKENISGEKRVAEKNLQHQLEQIAMAREFGVPIALGTDSGSPGILHGESVVEEIKLLLQSGFNLPEALRCATYNGACLLGVDHKIGLIAKGQAANFIVAWGTPAQLPRKLSYLEAIYINGRPFDKNHFQKI